MERQGRTRGDCPQGGSYGREDTAASTAVGMVTSTMLMLFRSG